MKISDIELEFESLSVITSAPQTNSSWLVQSLVKRFNGKVIELGTQLKKFDTFKDEILFITNTEMPILAGQCTADELFSTIQHLAENNRVIISLTLSEALVNNHYETGKQLARFGVRVLYIASLIVQLQPLKTGRARDTTGRFIVTRGPKRRSDLVERDLFYHVGLKGQVKLRTRV